jgi:hypothetical protein
VYAPPVPPQRPPVAPGTPVAHAPGSPAKPVVRGQKPDEARPAPLVMPTPEELGIPVPKAAPAAPAAVDWAAVHARLDRLGATAFALERAGQGYRFTCRLPADRTVEGRGATQVEAIRMALEQAERR